MNSVLRVAIGSILVGLLVLALKYAAYLLTGSVALYSDALESIVNVVTATVALFAVRTSAKPADASHPYGHGKVEYVSAVIVGVFVVVAAILILAEAYHAALEPRAFDPAPAGLVVNGLAGALNAVWCWVLLRKGRQFRSPALVADGKHLLTDVVSSAGVLTGVVLAATTGWQILDPALAALVAVNILWSGWRLLRESVGGLMDVSVSDALLASIRDVIATNADGALEAHDLRTRQAGRTTFVEFHLVVPGDMQVDAAHEICDRLEKSIRKAVEPAHITIHVEPEDKAKHEGIVVV
jgi:cation diffusion facilitator family transporter